MQVGFVGRLRLNCRGAGFFLIDDGEARGGWGREHYLAGRPVSDVVKVGSAVEQFVYEFKPVDRCRQGGELHGGPKRACF
jgi:hypothetical protein